MANKGQVTVLPVRDHERQWTVGLRGEAAEAAERELSSFAAWRTMLFEQWGSVLGTQRGIYESIDDIAEELARRGYDATSRHDP